MLKQASKSFINDVASHLTSLLIKCSRLILTLAAPATFFTKLSLFLPYFRLFSLKRSFRIAVQLGMGFCLSTYTLALFLPIWLDISVQNSFLAERLEALVR